MLNQFKKEVLDGLSKTPQKSLPSKYFYDKKGDDLFVQIMALPEYYLTRSEMEIFQEKTEDIISALSLNKENKYSLIELGAGDGTKTVHLLKALVNKNHYEPNICLSLYKLGYFYQQYNRLHIL
jgi:L-histidine N-alpha-methyltransferase